MAPPLFLSSGSRLEHRSRLRLSEHKGSLLTLPSGSRLEHRSNRHTHGLHQSTDSPSGDSGRDDLRSVPWGNVGAGPRVTCGVQPSVQPSACRRVDRGYRARPRSRRLSSGRCGSRSGHRSAIPDGLARSLRHDGRRSGSRHQDGSLAGGAMC